MRKTGGDRFNRFTVDDLGENETGVFTIATARIQSFTKEYLNDESNQRVVLTFTETGADKEYVLNRTSFNLLVDRYGNDKKNAFGAWVGKAVVLHRVETRTPDGAKRLSAWVALPKVWDAAVRQGVSETRRRRGTRSR